jgi:hypothetical protein
MSASTSSGQDQFEAFLVGYESSQKRDMDTYLTSRGASIITLVPTGHWLVKSTPSNIDALLEAFPNATAVSK